MHRNYMMIGVLLVIAAGHAWRALAERELPRFHLAISIGALLLAAIVAISRYEFPVRTAPAGEQTPARRRLGLVLAISGSLGSFLWVTFGPWTPSADFDVTGFLFLIQNIGPLVVLGILAVVACTGLVLAWPGSDE